MAKNDVLSWDTTAGNNTDIGGINIAENCNPSGINNAIRELMEQIAAQVARHVEKATGDSPFTALKADHNKFWRATGGAVTVNLTAAATLTSGWCLWLMADGGAITIDPDGSETINGASDLTVADGNGAFIICTGSAFYALVFSSSAALSAIAELAVTDGNIIVGNGSTWVAESGATARASLGLTIGTDVQAYDADTLKGDVENQTITGGGTVTSKSLGTKSSGTLTLDMGDRPLQHYTNNGAHTLAPGSVNGAAIVDITNGASAGAITTSGWTKVAGDDFTTTNAHKFRCHCSVGNGGSLLVVQALQ